MLSDMSRLTLHIGQNVVTEHDQLRHARQAIALARAGHSVANGKANPALSAQMHAVEARGHALLGDANSARATVNQAERHYERARGDEEPAWFGFYTEAELSADLGRCLRDVGDSERATRLITQAMDGYEPWRVRSRCFVQTDLAAAHIVGRDFEHAAAVGHAAVRTAAQVSSARTLDRLRTLRRQVRLLRTGSSHLGELDDRITDLLTRSNARRNDEETTA